MTATASHSEGTVGGPCHKIKRDGYWCEQPAVMVAADGYGYCARHRPEKRMSPVDGAHRTKAA